MDKPDVSIVIPLFNEAENIRPLFSALQSAIKPMKEPWEIIFVDDGSTDATYAVLKELCGQDERIRVVRLRRNFGQTAALAAGLDYAQGEVIVTMDGDLQNDPMDIPLLIAKLREGGDLVTGWRVNRQDTFLSRRLPSKVANWLISKVTGVHLHDYGCTLKAMRREIACELRLYGEMHRFIPALAADLGAIVVEVPVHHHPRKRGRSKYGLSRTFRVFLDLITVRFLSGYSTRPGHLFGLCGILTILGGGGITGFLGIQRLLFKGYALANRPLLLLGVLLIVIGVQLVTMGLVAELLSRTYHESQGKPVYTVREILGSNYPGDRLWRESTQRISSLTGDRAETLYQQRSGRGRFGSLLSAGKHREG